jgi:tetratricopeptide (TPR) repeat protein
MTNPDHQTSQTPNRLEQLEHFIASDPTNLVLRRETFDAALLAGHWKRAALHLSAAQTQAKTSGNEQAALVWALKEGDFWLAQENWPQAQTVLQLLQERVDVPVSFSDAVLHNLAYIDSREKNHAACVTRLAPRLEASLSESPPTSGKLQQLWLRALHHDGQGERALQWAQHAEKTQRLNVQATAVASTIALDEEAMDLAVRWSAAALAHWKQTSENRPTPLGDAQPPLEALVTQAWVALTRKDGLLAAELAQRALQVQPLEARAWSAWGYAGLLLGEPPIRAEEHFQQALKLQPDVIDHWSGLAWAQLAQQHTARAIESLRKALALDPEFAETVGALALAHALQGERELALQHVASAQQLDPSCHAARYAQQVIDHPESVLHIQTALNEGHKFSPGSLTRH